MVGHAEGEISSRKSAARIGRRGNMKHSALYVLPDAAGIVGLNTKENTPHTDPSRMFTSMWGAGNHPDAPPVTPFVRPVEAEYVYSTIEALANGWRTDGLTPCGIRAAYKIDRGPGTCKT